MAPAHPPGIGSYEILGPLGRGAMGLVYRARSRRTGELAAIKVLIDMGQERARKRFEREASALQRVAHPNVVRCLESGLYQGRPWIAVELISGGSLADALRTRGRLPVGETVVLAEALARGLAATHAAGVLHRDLKPDNVLLRPSGAPVLVDFGLARAPGAEAEHLTKTGAFLGTPGFWAPEQLGTRSSELTPAVDVFGLGAVIYAALTGAPPFDGENVYEAAVATRSAAPPSLRAARPDVPLELEAIVLRCLEKEASARFASAEALAEALAGLGLGGRPPRSSAWPLGVLAALALCALLALGATSYALTRRPDPERAAAPSPTSSTPTGPQGASSPTPAPTLASDASPGAESARLAQVALRAGDYKASEEHLRAAAAAGHVAAMTDLGLALLKGVIGGKPSPKEACRWLARAAEAGNPIAQGILATTLMQGAVGVPQDLARGAAWALKGAQAGNARCMGIYSACLLRGMGVEQDPEEGLRWLRKSAQAGDAVSLNELACFHFRGEGVKRDPSEAARLWELAARAGSGEAMKSLGDAYLRGVGVTQNVAAGLRWLERGAEVGHDGATLNLAYCYENGVGGKVDYAAAAKLYAQAAARGGSEGMLLYGLYLCAGRGVPADPGRGRQLVQAAARRGHALAIARLGQIHEEGVGGPANLRAARACYERALRSSDADAQKIAGEGLRRLGGG